jgi:hypothetical protein
VKWPPTWELIVSFRSRVELSSTREAVKIGPESGELKNFYC